ncbi:hypothetical protein KY331_01700 [Candidatus Woesearchaeota archaeon]|nr:hypothetical protein [Candidatus Woesearchaeota archaeon]
MVEIKDLILESHSIFTVQKLFLTFSIFSFALFLPYLSKYLTFAQIASGYLVYFLTPLPFILFAKKLLTKKFMFFGIILGYLSLFIYFIKPSQNFLYLFYIIWGLVIFLFWASYNIRYFAFSHSMNRATSAGHVVIVGPILNSFLPLLSVFFITRYGYVSVALIGFVLLLLLLSKVSKIPKLDVNYSFKDIFKRSKGMRTLKFLQGLWETGSILIPLYTLFFIKDEVYFGAYLAYIGIAGVIATLFVTRMSDKNNQRLRFFFPFLLLLIAFTISLAFANSIIHWLVLTALFGMTSTVVYPFFFAVVLDKIEDKTISMITREFMLNSGRALGVALILLLVFLDIPVQYIYLFSGTSLVFYLAFLFTRKVYVDEAYHPLSPVVKVYDKSKKLAFKVYGWGKVTHVREIFTKPTTKVFDGKKWITPHKKHIGEATLNKMAKGKTSTLFRKMKKP